jgi:3-isopropylmalate/(R)-2-methylmalate dehydratase small subunit
MVLEGRIWVLRDGEGRSLDDIDTDMIFHNAHLAITEIERMGQHALGNLEGWQDFPDKARPGDVVLAGRNFGAGSSRQQAVDCFVSLGVTLLMAESFGAIYKRNAINAGFPIMEAAGLMERRAGDGEPWVRSGDRVRVALASGQVIHLGRGGEVARARPMSGVQREIYQAGGLFAYGRTLRG